MNERVSADSLKPSKKAVNRLRQPAPASAPRPASEPSRPGLKLAPVPVRCVFYPKADDIPRGEDGMAPPGSMFFVGFSSGGCSTHEPPCTQHLHCVTPDGHWWDIDSRANNCTMKSDKKHRCWVRHGEPPNITVDKQGLTCAAGAGSIQTGSWHGYLRNGQLVQ